MAAFYVNSVLLRSAWFLSAWCCFIIATYRIWANEYRRANNAENQAPFVTIDNYESFYDDDEMTGKEGNHIARFMTVEDYINSSGNYLIENGFFEKEIHRSVDTFGKITQVFSTYESFHSEADTLQNLKRAVLCAYVADREVWQGASPSVDPASKAGMR